MGGQFYYQLFSILLIKAFVLLPDIQVYLFLIQHASALKARGREDLTTVASFYEITLFKIKSLETIFLSVLICTIDLRLRMYYCNLRLVRTLLCIRICSIFDC